MKTYCRNHVISENDVITAFNLWQKSLSGRRNFWRVQEEYNEPEVLISEIYTEICTRTLTFKPVKYYWTTDGGSGKKRRIAVHSIKQQVADYLVISLIEKFLTARIGYYQTSSTPGKGQIFAAKTIKRWLNDGGYWIHADVKQCYPSIRKTDIQHIINKYVKSNDIQHVVVVILASYDVRLNIGSYFSLRMAQLLLSFGYHELTSYCKTRRGRNIQLITHVLFYMDDIFIMSSDKRNLRVAIRKFESYLATQFNLQLKPWKIHKVGSDEPVNMAGYTIRPERITVQKHIFFNAKKAMRRFEKDPTPNNARSVIAYWGWFSNSDVSTFKQKHSEMFTRAKTISSQEAQRCSQLHVQQR